MRILHLNRGMFFLYSSLTVLLWLSGSMVYGQQTSSSVPDMNAKITIAFEGESLDACLQKMSKQTGVGFTYVAAGLQKIKGPVTSFHHETIGHILKTLLTGTGYRFKSAGSQVAIFAEEIRHPLAASQLHKGRVTDSNGKPLEGISITNTGSKAGASTDVKGEFSIYASEGESLEFSSVGYKKERVKAPSGTSAIEVILHEEASELGNTVIVGYSQKSMRELTGAVQSISGEEIRSGVTSVDLGSMLKGKVTGIYITDQNSGDPLKAGGQLLVRGTSSLAGIGLDVASNSTGVIPTINFGPLIVVDGIISPYTTLRDAVNPRDIKSVVFLKDAASTAIYGSRGSAGVIVITTRRGESGTPVVQLEQKSGWNVPVRGNFRFLNAQELNNKLSTYYTQGWTYDSTTLINDGFTGLNQLLTANLPTADQLAHTYDWTKSTFKTTSTSETNATVSGGTDKSRYYMGLGYYRENGTVAGNYLNRYSFHLNTDNTVSKLLSYSLSLNGIFDDGNEPPTATLATYLPWYTPYNPDGSLKSQLSFNTPYGPQAEANPLFDAQYNYDKIKRQNIFSSLKVSLHPTSWLTLSSTNSASFINGKEEVYDDARSYMGTFLGADGYLGTSTTTTQSLMTSNLLTIQKRVRQHAFSFLAGQEFQKTHNETLGVDVNTIPAGFNTIDVAQNLGNFEDIPALLLREYGIVIPAGNPKQYVSGGKSDQIVFSAFGEGGYNFKEKYFLTASIRTDASTAFGADKRYGTFYSLGGAWIASSESFIQRFKPISLLKFRGSYGTNGSQIGNLFLTQTLYQFQNLTYAGQSYSNLVNIGNPNLSWELTKTVNVGMDLGLWKRITLSADIYNKRSTKLLQLVPLTGAVGIASQYQNIGSVNNRGFEFNLNTVNIKSHDFSWTTNFNASFNKNKIIHLNGDSLLVNYNSYYYFLYPGEDLNAIKGAEYAGVDPATGKPQFWARQIDASGKVTGKTKVGTIAEAVGNGSRNALYTIGTKTPKFNGGFANTFFYKKFTLSILTEYVFGTTTLNEERQQFQDGGISSQYNQIAYTKYQHPWQAPGDTKANEPSIYWAQNSDFNNVFNSYMYDKNGFVRIRNVRLDYDIPLSRLNRFVSLARIYVSVDNAYTFTNKHFLGTDPEAPSVGGGQNSLNGMGEYAGMPRRYLLGLLLSF